MMEGINSARSDPLRYDRLLSATHGCRRCRRPRRRCRHRRRSCRSLVDFHFPLKFRNRQLPAGPASYAARR